MWKVLNDKCVQPNFCYRHLNFHRACIAELTVLQNVNVKRWPACFRLSDKWGKPGHEGGQASWPISSLCSISSCWVPAPHSLLCSLSSSVFNTMLLTLFLLLFLFFSFKKIFLLASKPFSPPFPMLFKAHYSAWSDGPTSIPLYSRLRLRTAVCINISSCIWSVNFSPSLRALTASLLPATQHQSKGKGKAGQCGLGCQWNHPPSTSRLIHPHDLPQVHNAHHNVMTLP